MIVRDSQLARGICGSHRRRSPKARIPSIFRSSRRFYDSGGRGLRRFEMHRYGTVAPGIFQLVTAIGDVDDFCIRFWAASSKLRVW